MTSIGVILSEERKREILDKYPEPPRRKRPVVAKPALMPVEVSPALAEAARTRPESVRVRATATGSDGVVVVDPPRPAVVVPTTPKAVVHTVDGEGRPSVVSLYNAQTHEWDRVDYVNGYAPGSRLERDWDPIARFEEGLAE
jgi:hypothetical protein